jgi:nucleotide-binding universal stress UspA family protein
LHPTDFSERSRYALDLAWVLARDHGARLIILHVVVLPSLLEMRTRVLANEPLPSTYAREAWDELYKLQPPAGSGVDTVYRVECGDPAKVILRVAGECGADLIVLGSHGLTGFSRLLLGSVAEHVVRNASCPVLTVKAPFAAGRAESGAAHETTGV